MRRIGEHPLAIPGECVAGAESGPDGREPDALFSREGGDLGQGSFEILLDVVAESLEWGNVQHLRAVGECTFNALLEQTINAREERCESLSRSCWCRNEHILAPSYGWPAKHLDVRWRFESATEPIGDYRMEGAEGHGVILSR